MSDELVHLNVAGGVGTITLDSPRNRNALSRRLIADLEAHLTTALADPAVRAIVLTGTGPAFCSGADLKERRTAEPTPSSSPRRGLVPILTAMWQSSKPIVGRINGAVRAGGLGLVAACDVAVAPESATFAVTEVRIGVTPAIVAVVLLPKLGEAKAMELFLTGEAFDARAAVAHGLLSAAAPEGRLDEVVERYVASLLKGAPGAMAATKRLVRDLARQPSMEAAFTDMAEISERYFASDEAREGMTAFAEKRPPRWAVEKY